MSATITFPAVSLPPQTEEVRRDVRAFLQTCRDDGVFTPSGNSWAIFNAEFSRRCGAAGFLGMTWPNEVGGHERSMLERYVVIEEMLAAGAPVGAHWVADRQSGPQILRHGSDAAKALLPKIAAGECYFSIGMSEPDAGSDLAAVRTKATRVEGGWQITGTKIWTTFAHHSHYIIVLARSAPQTDNRREGFTQFICDLSAPGVTVRPIVNLAGTHEFNEVVFDAHFVSDDFVVGAPGQGWDLVTGELAFERSGPDRFLSAHTLVEMAVEAADDDDRSAEIIGGLVARLANLRQMSVSVASMLEAGQSPMLEAVIVKDLGAVFEQEVPDTVRSMIDVAPQMGGEGLAREMAHSVLHAPSFSIRGGTREILRGMIARGVGLR
ncbi:acyl-CoA dehydrogenase family protein [Sulfitobacter sp. F26169L]|uniref:acyl-CoA dehydrogenase family protein n=1 Tax=Sulfitobacter sp. F26169L TaxID=2996015 RepID=UPI002260CD6A|nr:acyl-CoA dehydrogenase family protein [Sulfitobacter sp. F26169L]MCX7567978.1 acyl-CoA dehydrogenase family protein [Sulfitobacter sp. F26169L]